MQISISATKPTAKQVETILKQIYAKRKESVENLEHAKENSSVQQMYYEAQGQVELLEAILDYLNGNGAMLKTML